VERIPQRRRTQTPLHHGSPDAATNPTLTLTTDEGALDLFDIVEVVGNFRAVRRASVTVDGGDVQFLALDLPGLVRAKKAAGRPKDLDQLPELDALIALRRERR